MFKITLKRRKIDLNNFLQHHSQLITWFIDTLQKIRSDFIFYYIC